MTRRNSFLRVACFLLGFDEECFQFCVSVPGDFMCQHIIPACDLSFLQNILNHGYGTLGNYALKDVLKENEIEGNRQKTIRNSKKKFRIPFT